MQQTDVRTDEEIAEIERHKYFMSEQAGYDVGWETAERDWLENHAPREPEKKGGLFKRIFRRRNGSS